MKPAAGDEEALRELAASGVIRVAINTANAATVKVLDDGTLDGPAPSLANALASWAQVPISITRFESANDIVKAAVAGDAWDVAFLAIDTARANLFHYTPAYKTIEATIAVRLDSALHSIEEIDRPGLRIATSEGAAYDLVLQRTLQHAERVSFANPRLSVDAFYQQELEAVAGIREMLEQVAANRNDIRLLPGRIAAIEHAIATPASRKLAGALLDRFVADALAGKVPAGAG